MNRQKRLYLALVFILIFHSFGGNAYATKRVGRDQHVSENLTSPLQYPSNLWKGLLAEAVGEGEIGMYAVACCVRNRLNCGKGQGLTGLKRSNLDPFVLKCGLSYELMSKEIVRLVFETNNAKDITNGAIYFESVDFPKNIAKFDRMYQRTVRIGKHIFYKEK